MLVIPAIDLKAGRCVRLTQGRKEDLKVYDADPLAVALGFEEAGAEMIHVVDLDGAFDGRASVNREVARRIIETVGVPVQFGGGLRTACDVAQLIEYGASRVVLGTLAAESFETLAELVRLHGGRVCVGIDARDGRVMTRGWEKQGGVSALELARRVAAAGVVRVVYTDIARDGTLEGVNVEQTCALARATGLKVTASGGVSSPEDLRRLAEAAACGIDSVIVGKALYERRFTLAHAMKAVNRES